MPDVPAILRAIDAAFEAQVSLLFKNLVDGMAQEKFGPPANPPTKFCPPAEGKSLERFESGMDNAIRAREDARKRFVD